MFDKYWVKVIFLGTIQVVNFCIAYLCYLELWELEVHHCVLLFGTRQKQCSRREERPALPKEGTVKNMVARATRQDDIHTINVKGQPLRVAIRPGNGSGTPLLLMNGIGVSFEVFQQFIDELDSNMEIIRFDVPGTGGSPAPTKPYRFWNLCLLIARMLDQLGYERVDVIGVSWGGALAQQFALQYPRRCRRLVLVCTGPGVGAIPGDPTAMMKMIMPQRFKDPVHMMDIAADLYGGDLRSNPEFVRELAHAMRADEPQGYLFQMMAAVGWSSLPWLMFLRQPTLILMGDDDRLAPAVNGNIMHMLIPRSKLHIYHGGHLGLLTHAKELAPIVKRFLTTS